MVTFDETQPEGALVHAISGSSDAPLAVTRDQVERALETVLDPELGLSIMDLGLIYDVAIDQGRVAVTMTLTVPGCPIHDAMTDWVREAVAAVPGVTGVDVALTFEPPWTPDRIRHRAATHRDRSSAAPLPARASAQPDARGHTS